MTEQVEYFKAEINFSTYAVGRQTIWYFLNECFPFNQI